MISSAQKKFLKRLLPPGAIVFTAGRDDPHKLKKSVEFVVVTDAFLRTTNDVAGALADMVVRMHERARVIVLIDRWTRGFSWRDVVIFLRAAGFEAVTSGRTVRFRYAVARLALRVPGPCSVSVIVPARNERGNIEPIVKRLPPLGTHQEIVFVEGGSTDGTREECERVRDKYPNKNIRVLIQSKRGKGNAVYEAIEAAFGELMVILDSDMAIPPEALTGAVRAFENGSGDFINASRLVYPMEPGAMPWLNKWGNRFFARAYGWLMGQPRSDLFAGTKLFRKADYVRMAALRPYLGTQDKWGDLDLLLGAAKLGLKIQDFPVHYGSRVYGVSHMHSSTFLLFLIKSYAVALRKMKPGVRVPF